MPTAAPIVAAGAVVARKAPREKGRDSHEILLVHRPKYDDWSFPKGKLDPHEPAAVAAVREVAEETGLDIRLGPALSPQRYPVRNGNGRTRTKLVHYWAGRLVAGDDISGYTANDEIDEVAWVELEKARKQLTYPHDRDTLEEFVRHRKKSYALVVLRHTKARSRRGWRGDDRERPLTRVGQFQAEQLVPILAAYGVSRVVSSSSRRCWETVGAYAEVADVPLEVTDDLSEEDAAPGTVAVVVSELLTAKESSVICTHRPVLPLVFEDLRVQPISLDPGSMAVVHIRRGKVIALEIQAAPTGR